MGVKSIQKKICKYNDNRKACNRTIAIFLILLSVQLVYLCFLFRLRDGHHSDEVWNYGFANSYYEKNLVTLENGDAALNRWVNGDHIRSYLSVDKEHCFAYDAVMRNTSTDLNPPLQILILHTLCSFFPNTFSWYFCFILNLVAFVISQFFLFRLVHDITNNFVSAFAAIGLYGFGIGALDITFFLRIYALAVMFSVIFVYLSNSLYIRRKEKNNIWPFIYLFLTSFCGCFTLHLFLFFAFCITACYCIFYLFTKRFRLLLSYGFSVLGGTILSILLAPSAISSINGSDSLSVGLVKYPTKMQIRLYLYELTKDLFGLHVSGLPNPYFEYILIGIGIVVFLSIPFFLIFRKEKWLKIGLVRSRTWLINQIKKIKSIQVSCLILFLAGVAVLLLVSERTSIYQMGVYSNRYLFIIYPSVIIFTVSSVFLLIQTGTGNRRLAEVIICILCAIFALWSHLIPNSKEYFFPRNKGGISLNQIDEGANCVLLLASDWMITAFAPDLYNVYSYYPTNFVDFKKNRNIFSKLDKERSLYIIVDEKYILPDDMSYEELADDPLRSTWAELVYHEDDLLAFFRGLNEVESVAQVGFDEEMKSTFRIYQVVLR